MTNYFTLGAVEIYEIQQVLMTKSTFLEIISESKNVIHMPNLKKNKLSSDDDSQQDSDMKRITSKNTNRNNTVNRSSNQSMKMIALVQFQLNIISEG